MKSKIQLIVAGALVCASGCNTSVTEASKPVTPSGPSVKQNSQPQTPGSNAKPAAPGSSSAPTTPSSPAAPAAATTVLEGTWSTGCVALGSAYTVQTMTFSGDQGYSSGGVYMDSACTIAVMIANEPSKWLTITIGETDAKTGLTQVSDVSVDSTGKKTQEYNVFKIDGDTLSMGDASTVAGDYPTALDTKLVFKKQAKADAIPPQP